MKSMMGWMLLAVTLLMAAPGYSELLLVDDFESHTYNATIDNCAGGGVLGGLWDTESNSTGNIKIQGTSGVNQNLLISTHSSGDDRGGGINALTNPVENTETGVLFFRFQIRNHERPVRTYLGMHHHTGSDFLTSSTNRGDRVNAGFALFRTETTGNVEIRTTDELTVLKDDLVQGQWYNAWIVADNAADTFDLYISAVVENASSGPLELPTESDLIGLSIPFGLATENPLVGAMFPTYNGAPAKTDVYIDDIYWDGDGGLLLTSKGARNPVPVHRAIQVPVDQVLSWDAPNDPNVAVVFGYDVYLDPNETYVTNGASSVRKADNQPGTFLDPAENLLFNTQYFWRVDANVKLNDPNQIERVVPGTVWTFTTESSAPEITQQPVSAVVSAGDEVVFTVAVDSIFPPSYQWYKSADPANNTFTDDVLISGATSPVLTRSNVIVADEGFYYCKITNPTAAFSNPAALGVKQNLAHWTLDGLVNGQYEDSSGHGHHADPNGTPMFLSGAYPAATNNGVVVDVSNGWANAGTWNPSQYTGQLTFSVWVKWAGQPAAPVYQGIIGKRSVWATDMMWQLEIDNDPVSATAPILAFKSNINGITISPLPIDEWIQVVVSYDGTTAALYRNGALAASGPVTFNTGASANMMIGAVGQDPTQAVPTAPFNGAIDDIRIYNYAIGAVEAAYMYSDVSGESVCIDSNNPVLQAYDFNDNCMVDMGDIVELATHWLYDQLVP